MQNEPNVTHRELIDLKEWRKSNFEAIFLYMKSRVYYAICAVLVFKRMDACMHGSIRLNRRKYILPTIKNIRASQVVFLS